MLSSIKEKTLTLTEEEFNNLTVLLDMSISAAPQGQRLMIAQVCLDILNKAKETERDE